MKKTFLLLGTALLTSACVSPGTVPDGCEQLGGPKFATVEYGDKGILVTPKITVKQKSVVSIKLKPTSKDWWDKVVTITGKSVSPGGVGVEPPSWLNTSDSYNTRKKFVYCSPGVPDEATQEYTYSVDVGGGLLFVDPRVDVKN